MHYVYFGLMLPGADVLMQAGVNSLADAGFHCNICIVESGDSLLIYVLYDG